jgi:hypothetical protein
VNRKASTPEDGPTRVCPLCGRAFVDETAAEWQQARIRAAAKGAAWGGRVASIEDHEVVVLPIHAHARWWHRKRCWCGCRQWDTHSAVANGLAMSSGCELAMRRLVRTTSRSG